MEFKIQHTSRTMDCDEPDLDAFESNLCAIIRARESGTTAALVSNLCPKSSDPPSENPTTYNANHNIAKCTTMDYNIVVIVCTVNKGLQ